MIAGTSGKMLGIAASASANGPTSKPELERLLRAEQHSRVIFNQQHPNRIWRHALRPAASTNPGNYLVFGSVVFPCFMASDNPIRTPLTSVA
jgi:hypothetical protein